MMASNEMPFSALLNYDLIVLTLLLLAAVLAMIGVLRHARISRGLLLVLQLPCALLLLSALLLRDAPLAGSLIVLTAGASQADLSRMDSSNDEASADVALPPIIALGGVESDIDGVEPAPDLATALRRYPDITHVHVLGHGLEAHDRAAVGGRELSVSPPSAGHLPAALIEWELPRQVNAGALWRLRGRVRGDVSLIELRDPADGLEASTLPAADGRFELQATARAVGAVLYSLRLRNGESVLQTLPVPIHAITSKPLRVLLLAAVPSPELKYLRRWASDAGVELDSRISLAPGLIQARNPSAIDAATLAKLDLLIVDERSWPQIARQSAALREAIGNGLGVLIRITGPVPTAVHADWRTLGLAFALETTAPRAVNLDDGVAVVAGERLHAWPITPAGSQHVDMLRDTKARPLAMRAPLGAGRIGVLALTDSFRLATRGDQTRHATLWSTLVAELARARAEPSMEVTETAVVGQRAVICGAGEGMQMQLPDGSRKSLLRDPAAAHCAAFWPTEAGWHRVIVEPPVPTSTLAVASDLATQDERAEHAKQPTESNADADSSSTAIYVFDPNAIDSLLTRQAEIATASLVNRELPPTSVQSDREFWRRTLCLLWLLVMGTLWWLERRARQIL